MSLYLSESKNDETPIDTSEEKMDSQVEVSASNDSQAQQLVEEEKPYPLDIPSPLLLASSMVLAIASTGKYIEYVKQCNDFHW